MSSIHSYKRVIITGASRGFGAAVAIKYAEDALTRKQPVCFTLTATNETNLRQVAAKIDSILSGQGVPYQCDVFATNLCETSSLLATSKRLFSPAAADVGECAEIVFVSNAGSLGPLQPVGYTAPITADRAEAMEVAGAPADDAAAAAELVALSDAVALNVTSTLFLTSDFVRRVQSGRLPVAGRAVVVNVSSLAAVQPFPTWGPYCAGKAARDMYHQVLAAEQQQQQAVRVLNFAPGPMDTDMQAVIRSSDAVDAATRSAFIAMKKQQQLVNPLDSAQKLVAILNADNYENGAHVDYYDAMPSTA